MEAFIRSQWGIIVHSIRDFSGSVSPTGTRGHIINGCYFLKETPAHHSEYKIREHKLVESLAKIGQPVVRQIGEGIYDKGKYYQMYEYIPADDPREALCAGADAAGKAISSISKIKRSSLSGLEIKQDSWKNRLDSLEPVLSCSFKSVEDKEALRDASEFLKRALLPFTQYLNITFCHGDLHPANMLWKDKEIKGIIDWEIAGFREEGYDLAFMLGCMGMDDPVALQDKAAIGLIKSVCESGGLSRLGFQLLPEMVLATRLSWLSRWLLLKDAEAAKMEIELMKILCKHADGLRMRWERSIDTDFRQSSRKWVMQDAMNLKDVNKALVRQKNIDIYAEQDEVVEDPGTLSQDLRLMGIDFGMGNDVRAVLRIISLLAGLSRQNPDKREVTIEYALALGNSCLDLSRNRLIRGLLKIMDVIKYVQKEHEDIAELAIGQAFSLRNASIALAEAGDAERWLAFIDQLIRLAERSDEIEIKGELARALSNGITTLLASKGDSSIREEYIQRLMVLWKDHKEDKKINGAYQIAMANVKRSSDSCYVGSQQGDRPKGQL